MPSSLDLSTHLFLELAVILIVCHAVAFLLRPLGQTLVVGEMLAGVLLGPSFLGAIAPAWKDWLFPSKLTLVVGASSIQIVHPSMEILYVLGQLGLILYMFLIGLEFNTTLISKHVRKTGAISGVGIVVPVILGGTFGVALSRTPHLFGPTIQPWQAGIFLAAAMAITAFPVLARIIYDLGLTQTTVGTIALGAAATDDVTAWCLLAVVLATVSNSPVTVVLALGGGLAYAWFMFVIGRRLFARFELMTTTRAGLPSSLLLLVALILLVSAVFTDNVGIHSIFGAFVLGTVMPRGRSAAEVQRAIEPLAVTVLLPVFFAYSGLNTNVQTLADSMLLRVAGAVVVVAFVAKGGACFLASWSSGTGFRTAAALGALMNARGLMELILINIALDRGIITSSLFTILVLMTIVTTMVAAPTFRLIYAVGATGGRAYPSHVFGDPGFAERGSGGLHDNSPRRR